VTTPSGKITGDADEGFTLLGDGSNFLFTIDLLTLIMGGAPDSRLCYIWIFWGIHSYKNDKLIGSPRAFHLQAFAAAFGSHHSAPTLSGNFHQIFNRSGDIGRKFWVCLGLSFRQSGNALTIGLQFRSSHFG